MKASDGKCGQLEKPDLTKDRTLEQKRDFCRSIEIKFNEMGFCVCVHWAKKNNEPTNPLALQLIDTHALSYYQWSVCMCVCSKRKMSKAKQIEYECPCSIDSTLDNWTRVQLLFSLFLSTNKTFHSFSFSINGLWQPG